jgi:acetylornithine deacetylase/succinyl-diaminopimelate desuccinylase-like protein
VAFFSRIFDAAGIAFETAESAEGRGNIWARIEGGAAPGLILLHHIDVVPASAEAWETDPLKAVIKDGKLYGRGTLDTKGLGIAHLQAFLALHESGVQPNRDVMFLATADEEAGGQFGAGWMAREHRGLFADYGYLLNEGGVGIAAAGHLQFKIEVAQKRPYWLRLTASDRPGHGSRPNPTSATSRLINALHTIQQTPFEPHVMAPVRTLFAAIADYEGPEWRSALQDIDTAIRDPEFLPRLQAAKPDLHALLRDTCSITVLSGSNKINVVPPTASAELDCRILPDRDVAEFRAAISARVNDDNVRIEEILTFAPAQSSADTDLFRLLESVTKSHHPSANVVPAVIGGFTDSHFFRELGLASYGYAPFVVPEAAVRGVHGNNEHIDIASFQQGVRMMTEIVMAFTRGATP